MKKLVFAFLFLGTFFAASAQSSGSNPPTQPKPGEQNGSYVHIDLGRKSKDCTGFGVCKFDLSLTTGDIVAIIGGIFTGHFGNIQIQVILNRQVYENNIKKFPRGAFVLEEDFVLSEETTRALKLPPGSRLKAGNYKLVLDRNTNTYNCYINTNTR